MPSKVDPKTLIVPSTLAPGVLGMMGITTRGLRDALVITLGVGMCVTGLVFMVSGTKAGQAAISTAAGIGKVVALV